MIVITCDDYTGPRRTERNLKGELPAEELKNRLNNVTEKIKRESSKEDDLMNKGSQATSIIVAQYMLKAIF